MQQNPITDEQLDQIEAKAAELRERLNRKNPWPSDNESHWTAEGWKSGTRNALDKLDPAGLVAEVRRLRDALARERENYQAYRIGAEGAKRMAADRLNAVTDLLDQQELAARAFEVPLPEWVTVVRRAIDPAASASAVAVPGGEQ